MSVIGGTLVTTKGGQPWDRLESPLEGILSYRWKSRCRLLRNRLRRHRAARRRTAPRPLPSLSQNQWSSGAGITSHDCRGHKPESKRACENPQARGRSCGGDHRIPSLGGNSTTLV